MGVMNVNFYEQLADEDGPTMAPMILEPEIASEDVTTSGTSAQSAAAADGIRYIRVAVDVASYITFGTNPVAAAGKKYFPAGHVEYFGVPVDRAYKVAGITA